MDSRWIEADRCWSFSSSAQQSAIWMTISFPGPVGTSPKSIYPVAEDSDPLPSMSEITERKLGADWRVTRVWFGERMGMNTCGVEVGQVGRFRCGGRARSSPYPFQICTA